MAKTIALIVTYGNHEKQLKIVLSKTLINSRVNHIFIVNNHSDYDLVQRIADISNPKVTLISLPTNTGSAGGFGRGVREVYKYSNDLNDRLLILDDDSYTELTALDKIDQYEKRFKLSKPVWSLNRLKIGETARRDASKVDHLYSYYNNSFYRFSVTNKIFPGRYTLSKIDPNLTLMPTAPYSGLILSMSVIKDIGFPNEKMYLYSDDIEFTFRISQSGYKIWRPYDANIRDIIGSWFDSQEINVHDAYFQSNEVNYRALYMYRNEAYLAKFLFRKNLFLSFINEIFWYANLIFRHMPKTRKGLLYFQILNTAVRKGQEGELGRSKNILKYMH
ncbi:glycosyltransferase family protein [Oenococcus oeni]|uniref:hypothetical protein n=1 Tax=Oenococcus oeni TaxID=1247 RepID=UPI0010B54F39|nr:hypothetical protein [Oenococcus oeni]SYW14871.1 putative Glycosyltransferase, group 2 family protein [Oenococcus oeni]